MRSDFAILNLHWPVDKFDQPYGSGNLQLVTAACCSSLVSSAESICSIQSACFTCLLYKAIN